MATPSSETYVIPPPPLQSYPSAEEAEAAIHVWTKEHNYNVSRKGVEINESKQVIMRRFECDRAGKPKNTRKLSDVDRVRKKRGSKRIGCPMRLRMVAVDASDAAGAWRVEYTMDGSRTHNHPPSQDVRVHVAHRQRAAKRSSASAMSTSDLIRAQTSVGVSTSKVFATMLLTDPTSLAIPKDISNAKSAARREKLASLTSTEALIEDLRKHGFYYALETDPLTGRLKYLMWAHPKTTELARYFMDILVLDCTYKTNRYRLPLLNAVILTGMNKILPVAQVWLPGEAEPDYTWALTKMKDFIHENSIRLPRLLVTDRDLACTNATEVVFPDADKLLCRWHIERNVHAAAIKKVGGGKDTLEVKKFMARYRHTVDSESELQFCSRSAALREMSESMGKYLDKEWWPHKIKIVKYWTNRYCHFGCHDTSTVEGTHATMKKWLDNSKGDLLNVFERLLPWWMDNASRIRLHAAKETTFIPTIFREKPQYDAVVRVITYHALEQTHHLWEQAFQIVANDLKRSTCNGVFRQTQGRPCIHDLMAIIDSDGGCILEPCHFDKHWWLPNPTSESTDSAATQLLAPSDSQEGTVTETPTRILAPLALSRGNGKRRKSIPSRQHQTGHGINSTRRNPSAFEFVYHHAAQRTNAAQRSQSFQELLNSDTQTSYEEYFLPARSWGYAGRHPFDSD